MNRTARLALLLGLFPFTGCTCHNTDSTQIGVLTRKFTLWGLLGKSGVQDDTYLPGASYVFPAFITDWHVYDIALQNLEMVRDTKRGDRQGEDDISFKTIDGNDIRVDVTVSWQIDPTKASYILQRVGQDIKEVKEKLVRPACRSIVRDVLNTLNSEEFYVSDKRFAKANEAKEALEKVLGPEGVIVTQVILGEHHFHPDYEKVIKEKKLAEQNTERVRSEGKAATEQMKSELEKAKGSVSQTVAQAQGQLDTVKLQADAAYYQNQQRAKAIVIEKKAKAVAIQKENEALASTGGKTLVKLRIADALQGKALYFVPTGGKTSAGVQTLNLNELISTFAATQAAQPVDKTP